ncbi:MAG: hypothetical protein IJQ52_01195, partial [Bacteroidales bacterium]|nr:hypothetical protein [Bacteroidales bacterium]
MARDIGLFRISITTVFAKVTNKTEINKLQVGIAGDDRFSPCQVAQFPTHLPGNRPFSRQVEHYLAHLADLRERGKSFLGQKNALETLFPYTPPSPPKKAARIDPGRHWKFPL